MAVIVLIQQPGVCKLNIASPRILAYQYGQRNSFSSEAGVSTKAGLYNSIEADIPDNLINHYFWLVQF